MASPDLSELVAAVADQIADRVLDKLLAQQPTPLVDAKSSGLSPREFRSAIKSGELAASRVGRRYLARRDDLDRYLETRRVKPKPPRKPLAKTSSSPAARAIARAEAEGRLRIVG